MLRSIENDDLNFHAHRCFIHMCILKCIFAEIMMPATLQSRLSDSSKNNPLDPWTIQSSSHSIYEVLDHLRGFSMICPSKHRVLKSRFGLHHHVPKESQYCSHKASIRTKSNNVADKIQCFHPLELRFDWVPKSFLWFDEIYHPQFQITNRHIPTMTSLVCHSCRFSLFYWMICPSFGLTNILNFQ